MPSVACMFTRQLLNAMTGELRIIDTHFENDSELGPRSKLSHIGQAVPEIYRHVKLQLNWVRPSEMLENVKKITFLSESIFF